MQSTQAHVLLTVLQQAGNLVGTQIDNARSAAMFKVAAEAAIQKHEGEIRLATEQVRTAHSERVLQLRAEVFRDLLDSLVNRRLDALQAVFGSILAEYAEHSTHYMEIHSMVAQMHLSSTDPLQRADLQTRLFDLERQLSEIRRDTRRLYQEMSRIVTGLGTQMPLLDQGQRRLLGLPHPHDW